MEKTTLPVKQERLKCPACGAAYFQRDCSTCPKLFVVKCGKCGVTFEVGR